MRELRAGKPARPIRRRDAASGCVEAGCVGSLWRLLAPQGNEYCGKRSWRSVERWYAEGGFVSGVSGVAWGSGVISGGRYDVDSASPAAHVLVLLIGEIFHRCIPPPPAIVRTFNVWSGCFEFGVAW